jgi:hypothetical protein
LESFVHCFGHGGVLRAFEVFLSFLRRQESSCISGPPPSCIVPSDCKDSLGVAEGIKYLLKRVIKPWK